MDESISRRRSPLSDLASEQLVRLVQREGSRQAHEILFERHGPQVRAFVARLSRDAWLQAADVADAQQEGLMAFVRAIPRYPYRELDRDRPLDFWTFLRGKVLDSFHNFQKRRLRARRRDERAAARAHHPLRPRGAVHWLGCFPNWRDEPSLTLEKAKALATLGDALQALGEDGRRVWEDRLAGKRTGAMARERGCSPYAVRRVWHKIVAQLSASLESHKG